MSEEHRASIAVLTQTHNEDEPEEDEHDQELDQFLEYFDNPSMADVLIQI